MPDITHGSRSELVPLRGVADGVHGDGTAASRASAAAQALKHLVIAGPPTAVLGWAGPSAVQAARVCDTVLDQADLVHLDFVDPGIAEVVGVDQPDAELIQGDVGLLGLLHRLESPLAR